MLSVQYYRSTFSSVPFILKFDLPECEEFIIASLETSMVLKTQNMTSICVLRVNNWMNELRKHRYTWASLMTLPRLCLQQTIGWYCRVTWVIVLSLPSLYNESHHWLGTRQVNTGCLTKETKLVAGFLGHTWDSWLPPSFIQVNSLALLRRQGSFTLCSC